MNNEGKKNKRDVFLCIHDPIGMANQLVSDLEALHLDHEAFDLLEQVLASMK